MVSCKRSCAFFDPEYRPLYHICSFHVCWHLLSRIRFFCCVVHQERKCGVASIITDSITTLGWRHITSASTTCCRRRSGPKTAFCSDTCCSFATVSCMCVHPIGGLPVGNGGRQNLCDAMEEHKVRIRDPGAQPPSLARRSMRQPLTQRLYSYACLQAMEVVEQLQALHPNIQAICHRAPVSARECMLVALPQFWTLTDHQCLPPGDQ